MKTRASRRTAWLIALMFVAAGRAWGLAVFEGESAAGIGALVSQAKQIRSAQAGKAGPPAGADDEIMPGITLEFYREVAGTSHAAVRVEDTDGSFWQLELQGKKEYTSIINPRYIRLGIKVALRGIPVSIGDVIIYGDAAERKGVEVMSRHQSSAQICLNGEGSRRPLAWYKACLEDEAKVYTQHAFQYDPLVNNCSHFAEKILSKCGLANCRDYPYSTGILHRKGALTK